MQQICKGKPVKQKLQVSVYVRMSYKAETITAGRV